MNQDLKPEVPISSWLALPTVNVIARIMLYLIISYLLYIAFFILSNVFVAFGNNEYLAGNERLGMVSYKLGREFNLELKKDVIQCKNDNLKNHYQQAILDCGKIIKINKNYGDAYADRGSAYLNLKYYDHAITDYTKYIEIIPIDTKSYINRGLAYEGQGKVNLAIADFTKSIEINPKEPQPYFARGVVYAEQKNYDLAVSDFNKSLTIDPQNPDLYVWRGNAYADTKKYTLAIADYQKALSIENDSKNKSYIYCVQGITYVKMGEFESAITSLEQGVKLDDTSDNNWCSSVLENVRQGIPNQ